MEIKTFIEVLQKRYKQNLILTGLAALQYPAVLTRQLTFYNPSGDKDDYYLAPYHILIKRTHKKNLQIKDHLIFIAKHIELYANETDLIIPILPDISLDDFKDNDTVWRILAYLKKQFLQEKIELKKSIGRRYIDFGDINSSYTVKDPLLHIRDGLLAPQVKYKRKPWSPKISFTSKSDAVENMLKTSQKYFSEKSVKPLFHRFHRYASRIESAASSKIEGYDAKVEPQMLSSKTQAKLLKDPSLQANLNLDNLHRDIASMIQEQLSIDFLCTIQEAIVQKTWRNKEEREDKAPGSLRQFGEVIVERGIAGKDNVIYIAPKAKDVPLLLQELIDFYHSSRNTVHPLDLAAIFKSQLTIIHPFGDGNGRLARWCFLYILLREGVIENIHQAPISHIFLEEKNRYYNELMKVDKPVMKYAKYEIRQNNRYEAIYDDVNIYRELDYSSWIAYTRDAFSRALQFSINEHVSFEKTETIYLEFEKNFKNISAQQQHEIIRAIEIGLKHEWGKKTEQRLFNNGLMPEAISELKKSLLGT